jgi:protein O-GlcNAc transferase
LPEGRDRPITFGSFNALAKVNDPLLGLWSRVLQAVPGSRLLLKAGGLDSPRLRQETIARFARMGIDSEHLNVRGPERDHAQHLTLYGEMDIALDTFPYHGTTTTCEALWMGTPVITLAGASHVSRVGVSLLNCVGLPELVARNAEEYVRTAVDLANDRARLQALHATLRQRMEGSPLMDAPAFARHVEAAYRQMWRAWCEGGGVVGSPSR